VSPFLLLLLALAAPDPRNVEADRLFYLGKYQEALQLYEELASEKNSPAYLCNVGRCYARLGKPDEAIENMRACLAGANLDRNKRSEYETRIRDLESERLRQRSPREIRQDAPPQPTPDPPARAAELPAPGWPSTGLPPLQTPTAQAYHYRDPRGGRPTLDLAKSARKRSLWPWAFGAAGVIGVITGVGFGVQAMGLAEELGRRYDPERERKIKTANAGQAGGYLVGAGAFVLSYLAARNGWGTF
jgi:tetratricopeptide (TPR) repeat protein